MALRAEAARCQLWYAAAALKERRSDAHVHLDAAKHLANRAAVTNADVDIQLHGAIGVTEEHPAHLLLKHGVLLARLFGAKRPLLARLLHAELEG
jgi:alkylation response protein AidB-like acyl-CoA dehydrogenase